MSSGLTTKDCIELASLSADIFRRLDNNASDGSLANDMLTIYYYKAWLDIRTLRHRNNYDQHFANDINEVIYMNDYCQVDANIDAICSQSSSNYQQSSIGQSGWV